MTKKNHAIILVLLMICFFAFSYFFIASEVNHDCSGQDCPICEQIAICQKALEEIGSAILTIIILASIALCYIIKISPNASLNKKQSLVSLKIEMLS